MTQKSGILASGSGAVARGALAAALLLGAVASDAGTFDSGSDGTDGALVLTDPGTVLLDPNAFDPPLDPDGDGVYHFTTIEIGADTVVRMKSVPMGVRPVVWLASGDVVVDGTLDLNGERGHAGDRPSVPGTGGAGGYNGGQGGQPGISATAGSGPGGGRVYNWGAGASHVSDGDANIAGKTYGNAYLIPLIGGSGGAGATGNTGSGGGAGGGAILIASSSLITVNGAITANGGSGGARNGGYVGGGGSGGALRLMAPEVRGTGTLSASRGLSAGGYHGSAGRIRIEAYNHQFAGTISGAGTMRYATVGLVQLPESAPSLRVVSVGGVAVPPSPTGSYDPADLEISQDGDVTFEIEARNVPVGTVVKLLMVNETQGVINFSSQPLAGTEALSKAVATTSIPHGFSRFSVQASW